MESLQHGDKLVIVEFHGLALGVAKNNFRKFAGLLFSLIDRRLLLLLLTVLRRLIWLLLLVLGCAC
ncbi:hypothetical protein MASR1M12_01030 [Erysipelotrichia bacterium]